MTRAARPIRRNLAKALIVEDSMLVRAHLGEMLSPIERLEIIGQASDVAEAEELITKLQPDVVILDLKLATGSGLEVLRFIRQSNRKTLVIVLTNLSHPPFSEKMPRRRGRLLSGQEC